MLFPEYLFQPFYLVQNELDSALDCFLQRAAIFPFSPYSLLWPSVQGPPAERFRCAVPVKASMP